MIKDEIIKHLEYLKIAAEIEAKPESINVEIIGAAIQVLEQEPCEDAVSRETVEKITWEEPTYTDPLNVLTEVREKVRNLPSVTPIRPKGEWEIGYTYPDGEYWKCSECGELIKVKFPMNFCNSCGADMRGEKDAT